MSAYTVAKNLRDLAIQPQNRVAIVKDQGCLPGLVLFLDNDDPRVVVLALEALRYLSLCPSNRTPMRSEIGMLVSLKAIMNSKDQKACQLASEIHTTLVPTTRNTRSRRAGATSGQYFLSNANKNARTIILQISGLTDSASRFKCEQRLLATPGVVSFTFDLVKKRCILRARPNLKIETICQAVAETKTMTAQQIVKNDMGEENAMPDYLPEDDDSTTIQKGAVARIDDNNGNGNGWISSVTSFISKSFYW
ncbi:Armadillo repeat-containing protein 1 [Trichoplax sp. H2]|uniref:Armadillo repeat-containing protein 1 n=1 Tax=Trichoplax adhaerens TaxID=10228 RepID=B3S241_TRIAD|nr:hypothetical protein TRIADDRAFT_57917 [Trichoplax adhaerens]EDV23366.1 hypothetical protein TRIADDRAFT_57917 [Trichoplax adhaerens]RDD46161.1 Armadillo repeat-containing protein 1 [Trichoplax sp. H2]|eukprot:XP_002114276.1 hypothetical protein TRIADDRAFT_57917 [Trichoplax adhaerens]